MEEEKKIEVGDYGDAYDEDEDIFGLNEIFDDDTEDANEEPKDNQKDDVIYSVDDESY